MSTVSTPPPTHVEADGMTWTIRRAWPGGENGLAVEAVAADGTIRAGFVADDAIELFPPGTDPSLPALRAVVSSGTVISHRPGRRAVVMSADGASFVKVVRPGQSGAILDGIRNAEAFDGPFRTPAVLWHDESAVGLAALAGRSLHRAEQFAPGEWERAWREALDAWTAAVRGAAHTGSAAQHRVPIPAAEAGDGTGTSERTEPLPVHDGCAEARVLRTWTDRATRAMGTEREAFITVVGSTVRRLAESTHDDAVGRTWAPSHRDLHDKQLLWDACGGPALLDVDTACLAPAALDLGNLRAHALWRVRQGVWSTQQAAAVTASVDTAADTARVHADELALHQQAALLRLGCVYAFRPGWSGEAAALRAELSCAEAPEPRRGPVGE